MKPTTSILFAIPLFLLFSCSPTPPTAAELNEEGEADFRISCGITEYGYEVIGHFSPLPDKTLPLDIFAGKRLEQDYEIDIWKSYPDLDSIVEQVDVPMFIVENEKSEFWVLTSRSVELDGSVFYGGPILPEIIQTLNPGDSCFAQLPYDYGCIQGLETFLDLGEIVRIHYVWQETVGGSGAVHTIASNWIDLVPFYQMDFR